MMDYYYALLESYELLKKRKFKMSITEQDQDTKAAADSAISSAAGKTRKEAAPVKGADGSTGYIWTAGSNIVQFSDNEEKTFPNPIKGKEGDPGYDALTSFLSGGKPKKGEKEPELQQAQEPVDPEQARADAATQRAVAEIDKIGKLPGDNEWSDKGTTGGIAAGARETRKELAVGKISQPGRELSRSKEIQNVENRITNTEMDPKVKADATEAMADTMEVYGRLKRGEKVSDEELQDISSKVTIDPYRGVMFNGIYFTWSTDTQAVENNPFMRTVQNIQKEIEKRNSESSLEPKPTIKTIPVKEAEPTGGRIYAVRGVVAEHSMAMGIKFAEFRQATAKGDKAAAEKAKKEMAKVYNDMIQKGTVEEIRQGFQMGNDARLGKILADLDTAADAENLEALKTHLIKNYGLDDAAVEQLFQLGGDKPGVAVAIMLFAERGFTDQLFEGAGDIQTSPVGQDDSFSYGRKVDVATEGKGIGEHYQGKMPESARATSQASTGKFGGGVQGDRVGIELKTVNNSKKTVAAGSTADQRYRNIDQGAGTDNEVKYVEQINQDMDSIKPGSAEYAKKGREAISSRLKTFDDALTYAENGKQYGDDVYDTWARGTKMREPKKSKTLELAKDYMARKRQGEEDQATEAELEAFEAIQAEMTRAATIDYLKSNSDKNGVLNEEAAAYFVHRMVVSCGSDEPCVRVTRSLEDNKQYIYDNNAKMEEISQKILSGEFKVKRIGDNLIIEDSKGERQALSCRMSDKGWDYENKISKLPEMESKANESTDLLHVFLKNQFDLLSTLLGRNDLVG